MKHRENFRDGKCQGNMIVEIFYENKQVHQIQKILGY